MTDRAFYKLGLSPEHSRGKAIRLKTHALKGFSSLAFNNGQTVSAVPSQVELILPDECRNDFDVVVSALGWRIVSKRLATRIAKVADADFEPVPIVLKDSSGNAVRTDFVVLNALRLIDALSLRKSVLSPVTIGTFHAVLKLVLVGLNVPRDVHLFRVIGCQNALLIDDFVKAAIESGPHEGLEFIPVECE
ncbi:MAG TPA: DUF1629 domain-containing protein [Candidatus Limnocylindria bacterium]|nr:DUF1629 domain-containing protein [Candidatus Limnocylindria bacterium]